MASSNLSVAAGSPQVSALETIQSILHRHLRRDGSWTPLTAAEQRRVLTLATDVLEALEGPDHYRALRPVRVHFDDSQSMITSINGTRASVRAYYLGTDFEYDEEKPTHKAVRVEFLEGGAA